MAATKYKSVEFASVEEILHTVFTGWPNEMYITLHKPVLIAERPDGEKFCLVGFQDIKQFISKEEKVINEQL